MAVCYDKDFIYIIAYSMFCDTLFGGSKRA